MAAVTHRVSTASTSNVTSYASGSFTPAAGDLLVASVVASGTVDSAPNLTDTQNLGFVLVGSATKASSVDTIYFFVSTKFAKASSMTVTFNCPNDAATGAIINVSSVSSMTRTGLDAIKQFKAVNNAAAGTPALTFTSSVLTGNPTILVVGNATSPATLTPPTSWTEQNDTGYSTPTTGAEYVSRDSGFTGTTVTWGSSSATAFGIFGVELDTSAMPSAGANDPVLVQSLATNSNKDGETGNGFVIPIPNPSLSGNCLVVFVTYQFSAGRTLSITDDKSNSYTLVTKVDFAGLAATTAVYVCPNATAGVTKLTFTFDAALFYFNTHISEWANVATSLPVDVSGASSTSVSPWPSSGSMTTTLDHDVIINYGIDVSSNIGGVAGTSAITSGAGFTLLAANRQLASFSQYKVWGTHGAITPQATIAGNTESWNSVSVALKAAAAGTIPTGLRVVHMMHVRTNGTASPENIYFPSSGNLIVVGTSYTGTTNTTLGVSGDSNSNSYTSKTLDTGHPQMFFAPNATTSSDLAITITSTPTAGPFQLAVWDIAGAATSPYDTRGDATGSQAVAGTDITNAPSITPSGSGELLIAINGFGTGPPSGAIGSPLFQSAYFSAMTDADLLDSGDGYQHYLAPTASTINFGWHMNNPTPTAWFSTALAFLPAAGAAAALAATPAAVATATGALTTAIQAAASASAVATATAVLTTGIRLAASAQAQATASASLTTAIQAASAATAVASATAALTTRIQPVASAVAQSTATGALTTAIRCAALVGAVATSTAQLTTPAGLNAAATCSATSTAQLTTSIQMSGSAASVASSTSSLTTAIRVAAGAIAQATSTAALTTASTWAANATASATVSAALTTQILLSGGSVASSTAAANLTALIVLAANATGIAMATADMTSFHKLLVTLQAARALQVNTFAVPALRTSLSAEKETP